MTLEENLSNLEQTIATLERDDIPLEEAFKHYEKGIELVKLCNASIDKIEKDVQLLIEEGVKTRFD